MSVRTRPAPWAWAAVVLAGALVTACGEDPVTTTPGATVEPSSTASAGTSATDLTIAYDDGAGGTETWTLTCDPAGGTHPDAAAACAALTAEGVKALQPRPPDEMCTMIYGGPETATIKGTVDGQAVETTIDRKDGCGISRWKTLTGLVPEVRATQAPS